MRHSVSRTTPAKRHLVSRIDCPKVTPFPESRDLVSRIDCPKVTPFPESSRCPVFLQSANKVPPFPELRHLISRIVQMLGFAISIGQGAAVSRIGAVFRPELGHLVSR